MAKRFKRAKRTFRKRRFIRKRSFKKRSPLPRYDGMVRVKMQAFKESTNVAADTLGISNFIVVWGDQNTLPGTANTITIRESAEWVRYSNLYRYFRVQGCKMTWMPYQFNSGTAQIVSEELLVGSSAVGDTPNRTNVRLAVDFNVRNVNRQMHKYVGVAKARKNNSGNIGGFGHVESQPWQDVETPRPYHSGKTLISSQFLGNPMDTSNGMVSVTYYIWFKGQRTDVPDPA